MPFATFSRRAVLAGIFLGAAAFTLRALADNGGDMHAHTQVRAGSFILHAPYIRLSPRSAAAFFGIENVGDTDDRLIGASSPVAKKVELHTHIMQDGVAKMLPIEGGIDLPAGGMHMLKRGGDHVMFMGLTDRPTDGNMVSLTLTFEKAGDVTVEIPVDNSRKAMGGMDHMDGS